MAKSLAFENLSLEDSFTYISGQHLTIVVIGKTGEGKSATVNSIIRHASEPRPAYFKEEESPNSVTENSEECVVDILGNQCRLIDTIGLFDTATTPERRAEAQLLKIPSLEEDHAVPLSNIASVITLCPNGIDAFLLVIDGTKRLLRETKETINVIKRFLGLSMLDHCLFVLTKADRAKQGILKQTQEALTDYLKSIGYCDIGDRFVYFDNAGRNFEQVFELFAKIGKNIKNRQGLPYTNVNFQKAQDLLIEERQKFQVELEHNMLREMQIATDGIMAIYLQEFEIIDLQIEEYDTALYCLEEEGHQANAIHRNELTNKRQEILNFKMQRKLEIDEAVQNETARCRRRHLQNIAQLENNIREGSESLNQNNETIQRLQNQVNRLARR